MTGYWTGPQAFHRNVISTAPADAVFAIFDVFKGFLDLPYSEILPITHALRKAAIDEAGSSVNKVWRALIRSTQSVKITVLFLLQIFQLS